MRVVLADGTTTDREIANDGCAESMQSMAVIAAMTLDARRATARSRQHARTGAATRARTRARVGSRAVPTASVTQA